MCHDIIKGKDVRGKHDIVGLGGCSKGNCPYSPLPCDNDFAG